DELRPTRLKLPDGATKGILRCPYEPPGTDAAPVGDVVPDVLRVRRHVASRLGDATRRVQAPHRGRVPLAGRGRRTRYSGSSGIPTRSGRQSSSPAGFISSAVGAGASSEGSLSRSPTISMMSTGG